MKIEEATDELISKLVNLRAFVTVVHEVSNKDKCLDDSQAQEYLMQELIEHRLGKYSVNQVIDMIDNNDNHFSWLITYAGRDVIKKFKNKQQRELDTKDKLATMQKDSYYIDMDRSTRITDEQLNKVIKLLPSLFKSQSLIDFIESVLLNGKQVTKDKFNLTDRQFNKKMTYTEKYCREHRQKFINIVTTPEDRQLVREEELINTILNCQYDTEVQELFNTYQTRIEDLVGLAHDPYITYQTRFISDYHHAPEYDKVAFRHYLLTRLDYIKGRLAK